MKIKYIKEGYFKNPEQAREKREKEKKASNADKISGLYNNMYNTAFHRVILQEVTDYLVNYDKGYSMGARMQGNVSYCMFLAPLFPAYNCKNWNDVIPDFNDCLRVDYHIESSKEREGGEIIVTPRYSFELPDDYEVNTLTMISTPTSFDIRPNSYEPVSKSDVFVDMTTKIQINIGEKLAKEKEGNISIDTVVMKDLQKYQFRIDKVVFFNNMKDKEIEIPLGSYAYAAEGIVDDPKVRGKGFLFMIDSMLEKFEFGCKKLTMTYEDMFGIEHGRGRAYRTTPEITKALNYSTLVTNLGIDSRVLLSFLQKYGCMSFSSEHLEEIVRNYESKNSSASLEVFYRRYYKYVIENNKLTETAFGSLVPTTSHPRFLRDHSELTPDVSPVSIEFFGTEFVYVYSGPGKIKLHKMFAQYRQETGGPYVFIDKISSQPQFTKEDEMAIGWLNKIGEVVAKIIEKQVNEN